MILTYDYPRDYSCTRPRRLPLVVLLLTRTSLTRRTSCFVNQGGQVEKELMSMDRIRDRWSSRNASWFRLKISQQSVLWNAGLVKMRKATDCFKNGHERCSPFVEQPSWKKHIWTHAVLGCWPRLMIRNPRALVERFNSNAYLPSLPYFYVHNSS